MLSLNSFLALAQAAGLRVTSSDPTFSVVAIASSPWAYCYVRLVEGRVLASACFGQDVQEVEDCLDGVGVRLVFNDSRAPTYAELVQLGWMV